VKDGKWHRVKLSRIGRNGELQIDGGQVVRRQSPGILGMLDVTGNVFLGGAPNVNTMTSGKHKSNFRGCLDAFQINGRPRDLIEWKEGGQNVEPCLDKYYYDTQQNPTQLRQQRYYSYMTT